VADYQNLEHRHIAAVLGWSIAADILAVASAVVVSRGLGLELGVADLGWMRSVVFLLTVLPITVAGIGVREVGYATFFSLYGIDGPIALAYPLVLLSMQLLIGLTGAILESLQVMAPQRWQAPASPDPPGPR
jgi:uncharacterized membrane protein YbhN (UPF0104 family)